MHLSPTGMTCLLDLNSPSPSRDPSRTPSQRSSCSRTVRSIPTELDGRRLLTSHPVTPRPSISVPPSVHPFGNNASKESDRRRATVDDQLQNQHQPHPHTILEDIREYNIDLMQPHDNGVMGQQLQELENAAASRDIPISHP